MIITDVVMPRMNGWVVRSRTALSNATTAFIPIIFMTALTSPADRMRGFRIGADDYIMKPLDVCELEQRVETVLRSRGLRAGAALSGNLAQFGLAAPLAILELERKTGLLTVACPPNHALFVVKDGRIVRAELTDHAECSVIDCVSEVLGWSTGQFSFVEQRVETDRDSMPTTAILLEASRKIDELIPIDVM